MFSHLQCCLLILLSFLRKSRWCKRRLSSDELLLLWDNPPLLFRKLKGKDRKRLLSWKGPTPRVLGHMLRRFLNIKRGTVGVADSTSPQKNLEEMVSNGSSTGKRKWSTSSGDNIISPEVKRSMVEVLEIVDDVKKGLLVMSREVSEVYPKEVMVNIVSKKKDDSPVPFELRLYWLNAGLIFSLSVQQWRDHVVVIQ